MQAVLRRRRRDEADDDSGSAGDEEEEEAEVEVVDVVDDGVPPVRRKDRVQFPASRFRVAELESKSEAKNFSVNWKLMNVQLGRCFGVLTVSQN